MKVKVIKTILKQVDYSKRHLQFDINKSHLLSNPGKAESSIHFEIFPRLFSPCSPPLPSLVKLHHSSFPPTGRTRLEFRKSPVRGSFWSLSSKGEQSGQEQSSLRARRSAQSRLKAGRGDIVAAVPREMADRRRDSIEPCHRTINRGIIGEGRRGVEIDRPVNRVNCDPDELSVRRFQFVRHGLYRIGELERDKNAFNDSCRARNTRRSHVEAIYATILGKILAAETLTAVEQFRATCRINLATS